MTREEQIKKQADIYTDDPSNYAKWSEDGGWSETNDIELVEKAFIECAKWADKTMIEKACKWLDSNFPTIDNVGSWYKESFIKEFKKYLEE